MEAGSWKRLFLQRPHQCEACGTIDSVTLGTTAIGTVVALRWCCNHCKREWATTTAEMQPDRRTGTEDPQWTAVDRERRRPAQA
jgi:hypothetical protein